MDDLKINEIIEFLSFRNYHSTPKKKREEYIQAIVWNEIPDLRISEIILTNIDILPCIPADRYNSVIAMDLAKSFDFNSQECLEYIPDEFKDLKFYKQIVKISEKHLDKVPKKYKDQIYGMLIKKDSDFLYNMPKEDAFKFYKMAIKEDPYSIEKIPQTFELCLYALELDNQTYEFVNICPNPTYKKTLKNLMNMKRVAENKENVKKKINLL